MQTDPIFDKIQEIKSNMKNRIKIKEEQLDLVLIAYFTGNSILLDDIPGVGKTTLAKVLAAMCNFEIGFKRIQFTPDLLPYDIIGVEVFNKEKNEFEFKKGPIFSNIILADELNRGNPKVQSALLEAMGEKQVTIFGKTYILENPFFVIATQNPVETEGTFPLPEASLDRFAACISLGYPYKEDEMDILRNNLFDFNPESIKKIVTKELMNEIKSKISEIYADEKIIQMIYSIGEFSRNQKYFSFGFSPRALLFLLNYARGWAFINGKRDYVIDDDIKRVAYPVLNHRIKEEKQNIFEILEKVI